MAFARLTCIASNIDKIKNDFIIEKQNAIKSSKGDKIKLSLRLKWKHFWMDLCYNLKRRCGKTCSCFQCKCCYRLQHDGTCENFTLKSVFGFIGGFLLTYVFFMFFVFQLNFKLSTATMICAIFGSILTIGLAFSHTVRCIVFLLLPQFFSKRGRQALLAYAFILAITGPAKNTLNNMSILSESLACGQEQLKAAVKQIIEVIKKPFYAIRDAIKNVVQTIKVIVKKIKEILLTIKRIVMAIVRVIKAAFQFLAKIINVCNKELGTPFERCSRVFENAISDCNAKLGPLFNWLCSIVYLVQSVCYIVKIFDFVCIIVDFISNSVVGVVIRKIKTFVRHIRTMFYVRIRFSHSFHFQTNQSKTMSEVAAGIVTELRHRSESVLTVFDLMSCATSMFFLFLILKTMQYRYRFLTSERFDNIYITKNFRYIDMRRAKLEKETVLPLNNRERKLYVSTGSLYLAKPEKKGLSKSAIVLTIATVKLCTHMFTDYALYWMLTVIRFHARYQSKVRAPNVPGIHIQGKGLLADLLKSVVKAFQPMGIELEIDTVPCLPDPIPPDYDRYIQIVSLLILCWILTILEPYGLRLRQAVMCYYHPTRAKERAVWLYNHILRSRSSFLKFARRQLRRKIIGSKGVTKVTCKEYLRANIKSPWLRLCLGSDKQEACLLCGEVFREGDNIKPIRCQTPGCPGIYCEECFTDLQNLCTVCLDPIEYGDLSDISEERDSSEEEDLAKRKALQKKRKTRKKHFCIYLKCCRRNESDSDETSSYKGLGNRDIDSDYSSGEKTDYSYTYQDEKDVTGTQQTTTKLSSMDAEAQYIPDYTSMESYHDLSTTPDYNITSTTDESDDLSKKSKLRKRKSTSETYSAIGNFIKMRVLLRPSSQSLEEEEESLLQDESNLEATLTTPRSEEGVSSDVTEYQVPPLHLSPLNSSSSVISSVRKSVFPNVHYEVVQEISTPTSCERKVNLRRRGSCSCYRKYKSRRSVSSTSENIDRRYNKHRRKVKDYYKNVRYLQSDDNLPVRRMKKIPSGLIKFLYGIFHKKSNDLSSSAYNAKSLSENIDQVSLLSPKSSASTSSELNSKDSSDLLSYTSITVSTSPSTLMGSTPRKHLRGGAESSIFEKTNQKEPPPDLDSSDSDITLLEAEGTIKPQLHFSSNKPSDFVIIPSRSEEDYQMNAANRSPSTKIYSREPPERDESHTVMKGYSNQTIPRYQNTHDAHAKSDSSVLSRNRKNKAEDYFNTSLIEHQPSTSSTRNRELDSTSSSLREPTTLQKYSEYAVDDEGSCSESNCSHRRQDWKATHHIKHYRSKRCDKRAEHCCACQKCKCCHCQMCTYTTDEDQTTSNTSLTTDFMDLPYQHNNEYMGLVHELENTLSARNKERVRKTMREFEYLSRHNKRLEKPIFDDDEDDVNVQSNYCQTRKTHHIRNRRRPRSASVGRSKQCGCQRKDCICCFSRRAVNDCDRRLAAIPADAGYKGNALVSQAPIGDIKPKPAVRCRTRWNMDPRTGEWYKVYDQYEEKLCNNGSQCISKQHRPEYHRSSNDYDCQPHSERCSKGGCCYCQHGSKYQ